MTNLLSIFGFTELCSDNQIEKKRKKKQIEILSQNKRNQKLSESPSESCPVSPESENVEVSQNQKSSIARNEIKPKNNSLIALTQRKSSRRQSIIKPENDENETAPKTTKIDESFEDEENRRRSKRGPKPKNKFSPGKTREINKIDNSSRKRNAQVDDDDDDESSKNGEKLIETGKRRRILKNSTKSEIIDKKKREKAKTDKEEEEEVKGDSSESSESEFEEREDPEESSSSSSSAEDSEDDYMPSSCRRKPNSTKSAAKSLENTKLRRSFEPTKRRQMKKIPTTDSEVLQKIESGELPETVIYRAGNNCMFIPRINAEMIDGTGDDVSIRTNHEDYFKFVRVTQKTKVDHADPVEVRKILAAVRKRPIIWDQRLAAHHSSTIVRRAWIEVDAELGMDDNYPLARRKQIWKNKRDYFGYAIHTKNEKKWIYADDMEFYRPMVNFKSLHFTRPTISQIQEDVQNSVVLGNRRVVCTDRDASNLLMFILKTIHDQGSANPHTMKDFQNGVEEIFNRNYMEITKNYEKL